MNEDKRYLNFKKTLKYIALFWPILIALFLLFLKALLELERAKGQLSLFYQDLGVFCGVSSIMFGSFLTVFTYIIIDQGFKNNYFEKIYGEFAKWCRENIEKLKKNNLLWKIFAVIVFFCAIIYNSLFWGYIIWLDNIDIYGIVFFSVFEIAYCYLTLSILVSSIMRNSIYQDLLRVPVYVNLFLKRKIKTKRNQIEYEQELIKDPLYQQAIQEIDDYLNEHKLM